MNQTSETNSTDSIHPRNFAERSDSLFRGHGLQSCDGTVCGLQFDDSLLAGWIDATVDGCRIDRGHWGWNSIGVSSTGRPSFRPKTIQRRHTVCVVVCVGVCSAGYCRRFGNHKTAARLAVGVAGRSGLARLYGRGASSNRRPSISAV